MTAVGAMAVVLRPAVMETRRWTRALAAMPLKRALAPAAMRKRSAAEATRSWARRAWARRARAQWAWVRREWARRATATWTAVAAMPAVRALVAARRLLARVREVPVRTPAPQVAQ